MGGRFREVRVAAKAVTGFRHAALCRYWLAADAGAAGTTTTSRVTNSR